MLEFLGRRFFRIAEEHGLLGHHCSFDALISENDFAKAPPDEAYTEMKCRDPKRSGETGFPTPNVARACTDQIPGSKGVNQLVSCLEIDVMR